MRSANPPHSRASAAGATIKTQKHGVQLSLPTFEKLGYLSTSGSKSLQSLELCLPEQCQMWDDDFTPPPQRLPGGMTAVYIEFPPNFKRQRFAVNRNNNIWPIFFSFLPTSEISTSNIVSFEIAGLKSFHNIVVDWLEQTPNWTFAELGIMNGSLIKVLKLGYALVMPPGVEDCNPRTRVVPIGRFPHMYEWSDVRLFPQLSEGQTFICDFSTCWYATRSQEEMENHFRLVHDAFAYACPYAGCFQAYYNVVDYENHTMDEHNGVRLGRELIPHKQIKLRLERCGRHMIPCDILNCRQSFLEADRENHYVRFHHGGFCCPIQNCFFHADHCADYNMHLKNAHAGRKPKRPDVTQGMSDFHRARYMFLTGRSVTDPLP